jgi:O-antigen ligase
VYVWVRPVHHTTALRYLAFAALILATCVFLVAARRRPACPLAWPWAAYAAVGLLSLIYAVSPAYSASEVRVEVFYCLAVFVIAATMSSRIDALHGLGLIVVGANAIYVAAALAWLDLDDPMAQLYRIPRIAFAGVSANLLVMILPLVGYAAFGLWQQRRRLPALAVAGLAALDLFALVMSYNRQGLIALGCAVLLAGFLILRRHFSWRRAAALAMLLALIVGLFAWQLARRGGEAPTIAGTVEATIVRDARWELWRAALAGIAERPFAGGGFGRNAFSLLYPGFKAQNPNLWHAHNMVLNKGVQMGLPGIAAFLLLWAALAREFARHARSGTRRFALAVVALSTLAAVFVKNMTDDFFVRDVALLFWLLMGMYIGTLRSWAGREGGAP